MYLQPFFLFAFPFIVSSQYLSCPLLGPDFPPPSNLQNDPLVIAAGTHLTEALDSFILNSSAFDNSTSFSIQWFGVGDNETLFQYHHTAPSVAQSSTGVKSIDENSIYRTGSISKLYTMYLWMSEVGEGYFHLPITNFVPELAAAVTAGSDPINNTQWEDITIGALASHMAGIARNGMSAVKPLKTNTNFYLDGQSDLLAADVPWTSLGFPELSSTELPSCGFNSSVPPCNRQGTIRNTLYFLPMLIICSISSRSHPASTYFLSFHIPNLF